MTDKKKSKKVLVKVSGLKGDELDAALDRALDALLGPEGQDEAEGTEPAVKKPSAKKTGTRSRAGKYTDHGS